MAEQLYKVIIVGAGPGGLSAAARAQANQMEYLLLDKGEVANTLYEDYQFGKFVQAFPSTIPARSDLSFQAGSREEILEGWNTYANEHHLDLHKQEAVAAVARQERPVQGRTAGGEDRGAQRILRHGQVRY